ncbi:unnamed protein product [Pieris macdunnoughi]|uniref:phytanoyl-CoA dioxygenase n=1 Tax=Pieris macdunnoughi TaxID=345717 RepID=A0A821MLK4_9NEOP|nr:unnamed protein product [Pieris macdunnoughi]
MESSTAAEIKSHPNCVALDNNYFLSAEQKQFYVENGYLVIKRMFDFDELYNFKQHFIRIAKGLVDKGNSTVVREPSLVKKGLKGEQACDSIQDIQYDDVFMTYTEHPKLLNVVSQFIGDNIRVMNSMFINKPPGCSHHPPHQDLFYFPFRPAEKIIASWTAVDEVTKDNGCLFIIPRSHKFNQLYAHGQLPDANKLYHGILDKSVFDSSKYVQLEMTPGDTVFFHPLIVHGSGPNITKFYRKSITVHYASGYCQYVDVGGTVQEVAAKDIENEAQRRGFDLSFVDTWRLRSKQVMGAKANL